MVAVGAEHLHAEAYAGKLTGYVIFVAICSACGGLLFGKSSIDHRWHDLWCIWESYAISPRTNGGHSVFTVLSVIPPL